MTMKPKKATILILMKILLLQNMAVVEGRLRGQGANHTAALGHRTVPKQFDGIKQVRVVSMEKRRLQPLVGYGGTPDPSHLPLKLCEGDCDRNSDCSGDLICFQRGPYEPVPGCDGGETFAAGTDFCVQASAPPISNAMISPRAPVPTPTPGTPVVFKPPPVAITTVDRAVGLFECQGGCTSDVDCQPGLICFHHTAGQEVPGCIVDNIYLNTDYCIRSGSAPNMPVTTWQPTPAPTEHHWDFSGPGLQLCDNRDCNKDSDCAGDLICHQRSKGDPVPSECSGSTSNTKDYCVPPRAYNNNDIHREETNPSMSYTDKFRLRMYWEQGYYWQESYKETFWCIMRDYNGYPGTGKCWYALETKPCNPEHMYIAKCKDDERQKFVFEFVNNDEALIKTSTDNRCFERSGLVISLQPCDRTNQYQYFFAIRGGFDQYRFEISQKSATRYCLNQAHHPKPGEVMQMYPCSRVRSPEHSTSFFELW